MELFSKVQKANRYKKGDEITKSSAFLLEKIEEQAKTIEEQAKIIKKLTKIVEQQTIRIQELEMEVIELRRQLNSKSDNSHKPPSSDDYRKPKSERKSGGKIGAPKGHRGDNLHFTSTPDHVKTYPVDKCSCCERSLEEVEAETESRQVYDLPPTHLIVTEHVVEQKKCPHCGTKNRAQFPEGVNARTQYGPEIKALAAYMSVQHFVPLERIEEMTEDLFGHAISQTTVLNHLATLSAQSEKVAEEIQADLLQSRCIHADESGVRVAGKQHWVHVVSTADSTVYSVQEKRGAEGINKVGILPEYKGIVSHDCYSSYFKDEYGFDHALCGVHLMRECQGIVDHDKHEWARQMKDLLKEVCQAGKQAKEEERSVVPEKVEALEQEYDRILQSGQKEIAPLLEEWEKVWEMRVKESGKKQRGKKPKPKSANLLDRFAKHKEAILMSLRHSEVPFDNNQAERDIRMIKVKQKVSGSFRTLDGANVFARIRGIISTARKRKLGVLSTLIHIAKNHFSFRATPP
jgi:transposase